MSVCEYHDRGNPTRQRLGLAERRRAIRRARVVSGRFMPHKVCHSLWQKRWAEKLETIKANVFSGLLSTRHDHMATTIDLGPLRCVAPDSQRSERIDKASISPLFRN